MCEQCCLLHQDHDTGLAGNVDRVHMQYLVLEGWGDGHLRRSMDLSGKDSSSTDVLRVERVGMAVDSIGRGVAGGL